MEPQNMYPARPLAFMAEVNYSDIGNRSLHPVEFWTCDGHAVVFWPESGQLEIAETVSDNVSVYRVQEYR